MHKKSISSHLNCYLTVKEHAYCFQNKPKKHPLLCRGVEGGLLNGSFSITVHLKSSQVDGFFFFCSVDTKEVKH